MTQISSKLKFASRQCNIMPPSSSKRASRSTPNGSQEKALSHDFDCSACELTKILHKTFPSQLPKHFQIAPLPNKISSWLTASLLKLPVQEQLLKAHTKTMLCCGTVSQSTLGAPPLTPLLELNETRSLEPLPWLSGKDNFVSSS
jgi:hypothetical protein